MQTQAKHRDIQLNFKVDYIHKYTTSQSRDLLGIAVSDALVYNLMYMPLLTVIHYKREKQSCLERCWMVSINMCTSWWHTSAKCYTVLELQGLTQVHQPLQTLAIANDFQVWDLEHISEVVWQLKTIFRGFRPHTIPNPSLHLMCFKMCFPWFSAVLLAQVSGVNYALFEIFFGMG